MSAHISHKIRSSFNKAYKTYDENCFIQKDTAIKLMDVIHLHGGKQYDTVADFACGTGINTRLINSYLHYKKLYAIDFCENLLSIAKKKLSCKNIDWVLSDFNKKIFSSQSINLIVCNLGLQWSLDILYTMNLFRHYLKKNGVFAFSIPLEGTLNEIKPLYRNSNYTKQEIFNKLNQSGFELYDYKNFVRVNTFANPMAAIKSIKAVGANCSMSLHSNKARVSFVKIDKLRHIFVNPENVSLTYNMGIFLTKRFI